MNRKKLLLSLLFYGVNLFTAGFCDIAGDNYYSSYYFSYTAAIILSAVFLTAVHIFTFERTKKTAGGNVKTLFIQAGGIFIFIIPVLCFTLSPVLLDIGHTVYKQIKNELILPNFSEETICHVRDIYKNFFLIALITFYFCTVISAVSTAACGIFEAVKYKFFKGEKNI